MSPRSVAQDATQIASGSGIVFAGSIVDKVLRVLVGLFLSRFLGAAAYGIYAYAVKVVTIIAVAAPMGLDIGMVYFGARFRKSGERGRLKGTFMVGLAMTTLTGLGLLSGARHAIAAGWVGQPVYKEALLTLAPVVAIMPVMLFFVSCLRGFKDMRGNALAFQIVLPGSLLLGLLLAVGFADGGVIAALQIFVLSQLCGLGIAAALAWRHYGPIVKDKAIHARFAAREQLSYSFPQGLMGIVYRLTTWLDIVMLGWLATQREVGLYSVAVSLALLGAVPAVSVTTMFNPVISELVAAKEMERLNRLLQIVTRWIFLLSFPFFAILLLVPDAALMIYGPEFVESRFPLVLLVLGQIIWVSFAPTMSIIPMSGHALLNLANGLVALALGICLNLWLIPLHGGLGAAAATAITLAAWSLWRLVEVWHIHRCFPFSPRTLRVAGVSLGTVALAVWLTWDAGLLVRSGVLALLLPAYVAFAHAFGREADDSIVTDKLMAKVRRLLRR
jgi:O-antigen/teichoic acid export membrane protein